jgi:hypothetical protein
MDRGSLEPDVLECVSKIEQAVETLYFEWYYYRPNLNSEFTYRVEVVNREEQGIITQYIRLCSGSGDKRKAFYIGKLALAVKALTFLNNILCDRALSDLQRILQANYDPFLGEDLSTGGVTKFTAEEVIKTLLRVSKEIKPNSLPTPLEIDGLIGFFIQEYPATDLCYQRFEATINLLDVDTYENCLRETLTELLPPDSTSAFCIDKNFGRYIQGRFLDRPYFYYFDLGWKNGNLELHLMNIGGFPRKRSDDGSFRFRKAVPCITSSESLLSSRIIV